MNRLRQPRLTASGAYRRGDDAAHGPSSRSCSAAQERTDDRLGVLTRLIVMGSTPHWSSAIMSSGMDTQVAAALIGSLLGGGVSGAVIGALVTLWQQRRVFEHERRTRFVDLKRERYALLVHDADEWVRLVNNQRAVAYAAERGEADWDGLPALPPTTDLAHQAEEIALLAPKAVGEAARQVAVDVIALGPFSVNRRDLSPLIGSLEPYSEAVRQFYGHRALFFEAAKADLESA